MAVAFAVYINLNSPVNAIQEAYWE